MQPYFSKRKWKWLYFLCYGILIADALFVIGKVLYDFVEYFSVHDVEYIIRFSIIFFFIVGVYLYSIFTAIRRKWLHSLIIYGGFTTLISLHDISDFPKEIIPIVVSTLFAIGVLTVHFLSSGPTRKWYGTKASLKVFGVGFFSAIVLIMASLWLNMHHGPPGSFTIHIPAWLRGWYTFFGGGILGIFAQVYSLVFAVRSYFKQINKKSKRVLLIFFWITLLLVSLLFWSYGAFIVIASWFV